MARQAVPALLEFREQLDAAAPDRDRTSDGTYSDAAHQASSSSHNSDLTQNAEHKDGDSLDEIRAIDVDTDLRRPDLTMPQVVQHLVMGARTGRFWWLRYIIHAGVIYHRNVNNFAARAYTGANRHDKHAHVNTDFTQAADTVHGVNYGLGELVGVSQADVLAALRSTEGQRLIGGAVKEYRIAIAGVTNSDGTPVMREIGTVLSWIDTNLGALRAAVIDAVRSADDVDEQALANALVPLLTSDQLEAVIRKGMTPEQRLALAARLQAN